MKAKVWEWDAERHEPTLTELDLTKTVLKQAKVEVMCGLPHNSIHIPSQGWKCRYARGYVKHRESGLIIRSHDCHWCNGYLAVPAFTPVEERRCDNCGGPLVPTGESAGAPDLLMLADFPEED